MQQLYVYVSFDSTYVASTGSANTLHKHFFNFVFIGFFMTYIYLNKLESNETQYEINLLILLNIFVDK